MKKTIIELLSREDGTYQIDIELQAIMLKPEEHKEVRKELEEMKFIIIQMDADSIKAKKMEENYGKGMIKKLEKKGWNFEQ